LNGPGRIGEDGTRAFKAADAVRVWLDWKYLLRLRAGDPGFDHTVLTPRYRVSIHGV